MAEDCWPMKLALALFPSPAPLAGVASLVGLAPDESAIVLSLVGPEDTPDADARLVLPWLCLFKRGSCRVSALAEPDLSSGRSAGDTE